jgi:hypothetical protein
LRADRLLAKVGLRKAQKIKPAIILVVAARVNLKPLPEAGKVQIEAAQIDGHGG